MKLQRYKCQWLHFEPSSSTPLESRGGRYWFNRQHLPCHFSAEALRKARRLVERAGAAIDVEDDAGIILYGRPGETFRRLGLELEQLLGKRTASKGATVRVQVDY